ERRPTTFDDFDAIDPADRVLFEVNVVDLTAGNGQAVDEDEYLLRRGAADSDGRDGAEGAVAYDVDTGERLDRVGHGTVSVARDLRGRDDIGGPRGARYRFETSIAGNHVCDFGNGRRCRRRRGGGRDERGHEYEHCKSLP